jgi:hypothetical protein
VIYPIGKAAVYPVGGSGADFPTAEIRVIG